jgi:hypothetical protein
MSIYHYLSRKKMKALTPLFYSSLLLIFSLISCNKPVYKYNPDFEGKWRTVLVYDSNINTNVMCEIIIDGAEGSFKNTCNPCGVDLCNCISSQTGKAVLNSDKTQMKIGSSNALVLSIDEEPNIDSSGLWTMKIRGLRYFRQ